MRKTTDKKRWHDSTKMIFHMERVIDYYDKKKLIAPIHIDVGLTKKCNMLCTYCYGKMQDLNGSEIGKKALLENLIESAAKIGVKSLGFIGDGEPTLNPYCFEGLALGKKLGLSMAMSTNGILLDSYLKHQTVLQSCDWMRFNISAYTEKGYRDIHKSNKRDIVFQNVKDLVELKNDWRDYKTDIGIQMVFDPSSMLDEVLPLSKFAIDVGVDYFVIKQCSLPDNGESGMKQFDVKQYDDTIVKNVLKEAESLSTYKTQIIPKWNIMDLKGEKPYRKCLSIPVLSEISGDGGFYPCGYFFGGKRKDMCFGNLHDNTLEEMIKSNKYWEIINNLETTFEPGIDCKGTCRQDAANIFLDEYVNDRPSGINFI